MTEVDRRTRLAARDFIDLRSPHTPTISPDGAQVVYAVSTPDYEESRWVSRLWVAKTEGGPPRQLTFSYEGEHEPSFSPDGRYVAFLSSRPDMTEPPPSEDDDRPPVEQVWVLPMDGGEAVRLTKFPEGVLMYRWMPDSQSVVALAVEHRPAPLQHVVDEHRRRRADAVVEGDPRPRRQLWDVDLDEKRPELLHSGDPGIVDFDLSPDGKRLVFCSNGTGDPNDWRLLALHVLDVESGDTKGLLSRPGGQYCPRWSPDGLRIAFIAPREPEIPFSLACAWTIGVDRPEPMLLCPESPLDVRRLAWRAMDQSVVALGVLGVNGPLCIEAGRAYEIVAGTESGECLDYSVARDGSFAAVIEMPAAPAEVWWLPRSGERRSLTDFGAELIEHHVVPRQEVVSWESDGRTCEGILVRPDVSPPWPLVVQLHGGPHGRAANTIDSYGLHAVWASEGYAVFLPNFRGSEGYGNDFALAIRRDLGHGPLRDVLSGVDGLVAQGLVDPDRIGVMGGSYGGYLTNWAISQTDRFAGAISMFGVYDLMSDYGNSEIAGWEQDYLGAWFWDDPEIYRELSPASHVANIRTPLLIIHGECDNNTFISNSKELYRALRDRGARVEFVHYPREGHGISEPRHRLDEMARCLAWFDEHVKRSATGERRRRAEEVVRHDGYELRLLAVQDVEEQCVLDDDERLVEVAFAVASEGEVENEWTFPISAAVLRSSAGDPVPCRGLVIDTGKSKAIVEGIDMTVAAQPDRASGRVAFGLCLAFAVPWEGGAFELRVADLPVVEVSVPHRTPDESRPEDGEEHT